MNTRPPTLPSAPRSIQKGTPLKLLLGAETIECLALNIQYVHPAFAVQSFCERALTGLEPLELMQRGRHIANALHECLPRPYAAAIDILTASLTPADTQAEAFGLAGFLYLPHSFFIASYGQDPRYNEGEDPFDASMRALRELTMRFTAEFAIRPFLIQQQERTLNHMTAAWLHDPNPHVRRLCSEGTRPKLPWGKRIPAFIADPAPTLPILAQLKNDPSLYVRRSVANHLGDVAKDHLALTLSICTQWLQEEASAEVRWVIRHALRHPAKKGDVNALNLRAASKKNPLPDAGPVQGKGEDSR